MIKKYILKRLLKAIPLLIALTVTCFFLIHSAPYDAIDYIATPQMTKDALERLRRVNGLDKPLFIRYLLWVRNLLKGDLGYSIITHESIKTVLAAKIPNTLILMVPSYILSNILALTAGLYASQHVRSRIRKIIDGLVSLGLSVPFFWFCLLFLYLFGYQLGIFPIAGMHSIGETGALDFLKHYVSPFICLAFAFLPDLFLYVETSADDELKKDYVTVQKAMGAADTSILRRHILINVLKPVVTKIGMALPGMLTGSLIVETMFAWPGMGSYYVKAIQAMDYPVVMIILLLSGVLVIAGNLLSDICCFVLDPRIRDEHKIKPDR